MVLTIEIFKKKRNFVAKCKELDIYSYGSSSEMAVKRLKKVIAFYVQSAGEYLNEDKEVKANFSINTEFIN
ncbi:MAG: hypothetical protein KKH98_00420 [Spirochaetes bacterium]|nr:hypothetical protein [Spirochaetota bacterium]